ncbi:MAG TPA: MBL fold metallo-hydrolase, partial [Caproiciproducens sp.]|nr:MBL fold metallo-hydrolase [Caproiciproducens sp.]
MEQQKTGKKALKIILLLLLAAGLVISFLPYGAAASWHKIFSFFGLADFSAIADSSPFSVHVIDVGKADSIFVECGGKTMLVDGGTADRGEPVAEYLNRRGVKKLDYVVNTHPDDDHIGGLAEIFRQYPVGRYLAPELPAALIPAGEPYRNVQEEQKKKKLSVTVPKQGQFFLLGNAKVNILAPVKTGESTNNNSVVLRITFKNTSLLLMGDAQKEEEIDLLQSGAELSADVLKVGHHGSSTSTTEAFLKAVKPKYAAISVADDTSG